MPRRTVGRPSVRALRCHKRRSAADKLAPGPRPSRSHRPASSAAVEQPRHRIWQNSRPAPNLRPRRRSSADGHVRPRSPRLPQAQAENILASLAGRSNSSDGARPRAKLPPAKPRPPCKPDQSSGKPRPTEHAGDGPGPRRRCRRTETRPGRAAPKAKSQRRRDDGSGTAARPPARGNSPASVRRVPGASPYSNDILPAKPKSRFTLPPPLAVPAASPRRARRRVRPNLVWRSRACSPGPGSW